MKVCISTESTADLSPELLKEYDISVIPFRILLGEDIMADGEINALDIFNFVEEKKLLFLFCKRY